jgi:CheY-like chemotaxis protein
MRNRIETHQAGVSLTAIQDDPNTSQRVVCMPSAMQTPPRENRANVLLVSTSGTRTKSYCQVAETLGCKVHSCSSEADAHRSLKDGMFDVIIMDQRGVVILDWDMLMRIVVEDDPELPVLVITAGDQGTHFDEALQRGATDCFREVHSAAELLPWLDTYLPIRPRNQFSDQNANRHPAYMGYDHGQAAENRAAARRQVTMELAYHYWEGRGSPVGSSEIDWFRAEMHIKRYLSDSTFEDVPRGQHLSHTRIPLADDASRLPRGAAGKNLKRVTRESYWSGRITRI